MIPLSISSLMQSRQTPTAWRGRTRLIDADKGRSHGFATELRVRWPIRVTVNTTVSWYGVDPQTLLYEHQVVGPDGSSCGLLLSPCASAADALRVLGERGSCPVPRKVMWVHTNANHVRARSLVRSLNDRIWSFAGEGIAAHLLLAALGVPDDPAKDVALTVVLSDLSELTFSRGDCVAW